jgi:hypothetical protein
LIKNSREKSQIMINSKFRFNHPKEKIDSIPTKFKKAPFGAFKINL